VEDELLVSSSDSETVQNVTDGEHPQSAQPEARRSIFVSYKHGDAMDGIIARIDAELSGEYDVFVDKKIPLGDDWEKTIVGKLNQTDFVIALISADAIDNGYIIRECEIARRRHDQEGSPLIYLFALRLKTTACVYPCVWTASNTFPGGTWRTSTLLSKHSRSGSTASR
jgi:TIR domain